jgi:uncharacterized membrane protein (UPF0127 family)
MPGQCVNRTKQVMLAPRLQVARSLWARMKGLIGRVAADFPPGSALWLTPCRGIHTVGMSFSIDAVYLDARGAVVRAYHGLAPFRVASLDPRTRSVVEFPAGTLKATGTEVGDLLDCSSGFDAPGGRGSA